jgi:hypothetical protein
VVNSANQTAGPFLARVPPPLGDWTAYTYTSSAAGTFSVTTSSANDAATVTVP